MEKYTKVNLFQHELLTFEEKSDHNNSQNPQVIEMWKLYRSVIEHEDDLINYRLQWLILAQTLLFTGYSVIFASDSVIGKISNKTCVKIEVILFLLGICLLGFSTTFFSYKSMFAAIDAINTLKSYFEENVLKDKNTPNKILI